MKTKRKDKTYEWKWESDAIGINLKYQCFVDGELYTWGGEYIEKELHRFQRQFDWALTASQSKKLYDAITKY